MAVDVHRKIADRVLGCRTVTAVAKAANKPMTALIVKEAQIHRFNLLGGGRPAHGNR
jgi:hypothetical protein